MINKKNIEIVKFLDGKYGIRHTDKYGEISFYDKTGYWWPMRTYYKNYYRDCQYQSVDEAKKYYNMFTDVGIPVKKDDIETEKPKKSFIDILLERVFKKHG